MAYRRGQARSQSSIPPGVQRPNIRLRRQCQLCLRVVAIPQADLVHATQLCPTVTLLDVEKAFRPRSVRWIEIYVSQGLAGYVKDKSHIPKGLETEKYAIVHFKDGIWAYKALRENGKMLNGQPMLVRVYWPAATVQRVLSVLIELLCLGDTIFFRNTNF